MISSTQNIRPAGNNPLSNTREAATKESMNYDNFIQLLTTELKNQDPLKPLDPTQTVTQLATFSNVEQAIKTNNLLSHLLETSLSNQSASLIGRTISTDQGQKLGSIRSITSSGGTTIAITEKGERIRFTPDLIIS